MKIRIWRRVPLIWCWYCPVCGKMWRNRQYVAHVRPAYTAKYWPLWSTEVNTPNAWVRCIRAAHTHIKKYHSATVPNKTQEVGNK